MSHPPLYKYRTTDNWQFLEDIIVNRRLYAAPFRDLNDPMEGFYDPSDRIQKLDDYAGLARELLSQKHTVGICCFTDTPDNELMWTHYADSYTGHLRFLSRQEDARGFAE